jgi:hypothetical protein
VHPTLSGPDWWLGRHHTLLSPLDDLSEKLSVTPLHATAVQGP